MSAASVWLDNVASQGKRIGDRVTDEPVLYKGDVSLRDLRKFDLPVRRLIASTGALTARELHKASRTDEELFQPLNKEEREMKVILQLISEKAAQKFNSIRSALRHLDADCDGNVDRSEVRHFFRGYNFTEEVADRFFEYLDKEKRGMLDYAKFVNFIRPFLEGAINGTPLTARDLTSCRGAPDSVLEDMLEVTDERQDRLHEFDGKFQESLRILTSKALDRFGSLANAFRFVDLDRNCNMTRNETEYLFRLCNLPAELAVKFHDAVDTNGSGEISLQEFHAALAPYLSDEDQKRQQLKKKKDYLLKPYTPERADEDLRSASKRAASKEWNKHVDFELRNELRRLMQDVGDKLLLKFKHVRDAFKPLNLQRLGKITREEMHNFFRGFGHPEEVADRIFDLLDQEGKGEIEYSVFMSHFESVLGRDFRNFSEQPPIYLEDPIKCKEVNETADSLKRRLLTRSRNMKEAFRALDSDHDGQVSRSELRMFGKKVGVTMQSCDQLFDALDVEGVGSINFLQFTRIFPEGKNAGTPRAVYAKPVPQPPELL